MQLFYDLIKITLRCVVPWYVDTAGGAGAVPVGAGVQAGTTALNCSLFQTAFP